MALLVAPSQAPIWLLEVVIGTETLRFGQRPCVVGTGAAAVRFTGALAVEFVEELELTADGPPVRQVSIQLGGEQGWGELRGHLFGARARLYEWGGGEFSAAELKLTGTLDEPATSDPDLPPGVLACTLTETEGEDRGLLLEVAVADETTFPIEAPSGFTGDAIPSAYAGAYYPEVIGRPGTPFPTWFTADGVAPGSPAVFAQHKTAPLYDSGTLIIAKRGSCRVSSARAWDQDGGTDAGDLITVRDLRGQVVTVFDQSTLATVEPAAASDVSTGWAVGWSAPPTTGPGGALRGLGDVLVWALERAGVDLPDAERGRAWDIDWAATLTDRGSLNRLKIDTYISDQVGVWEWLTRDILPFFPVFLGRTGRGIYLAEWRYRARPSEAVVEIEAGRNAQRISTVSALATADVYTEITTRLGLDVRSGNPLRQITFDGSGTADASRARHALLELAYSRVGRRATTLDVPVVWDRATGWEVGEYLCARYAAPLGEVWYRLPWQYAWLRPGQVVTQVDAEPGVSGVATITGRRPGPGCVDVRLLPHS